MPRFVNPRPQFLDDAGDPLVSGNLYIFDSGTDTLKTTYADVNLTIPNTNPVILTGDGRVPNIWFDGTARIKLTDSDDVQIWDIDPVSAEGGVAAFDEWVPSVIYGVNNIVEGSDGAFYISFTSGNEGNDPTTTPTEWQEVEFINVWNTNVTYGLGDTVKASDNNFYRSTSASNQGNDPTLGVDWEVPFDLSAPGPIGGTTPSTGDFTALTATTLDTGQGANELYPMDQAVRKADNPEYTTGLFIGGPAAENLLDVYEFSDAQPPIFSDATTGGNVATGTLSGSYTLTGRSYNWHFEGVDLDTTGMTGGNTLAIQNMPFIAKFNARGVVEVRNGTFTGYLVIKASAGTSFLRVTEVISGSSGSNLTVSDLTSGTADIFGNIEVEV
jgi:hypothetical protein